MNRTVRKNSLLFLAGSGLYPLLEVLWRGYSHASMALAGRRLSAAHQRRMLRKNEKKKPSGALRHRLPHHNRCGIFIRPARKPRASSACVGLLRPAAQHHGPDLSAVFAHLVRFNDPRKRPVQALLPPFRLPERDKIRLGHHRPLIYFWNTGKMPILSGACNGICGNAS